MIMAEEWKKDGGFSPESICRATPSRTLENTLSEHKKEVL